MLGVITSVTNPKRNISCTTDMKKNPNNLGFAPSLSNILNNCPQLFLAFCGFPTTAGQSSFNDVMIPPGYLKDVAKFSGMT